MSLQLSLTELKSLRDTFAERIQEGLQQDDQQIRALPAHLPPPPGLEGEAIVLDVGGTNMRAALVTLKKDGPLITKGPIKERLPVRDPDNPLTKARFFQMQAKLIKQLEPHPELPVGYCFSYPSEVLPSRDARLIKWTKGLDIPGVEGALVGEALVAALVDEGLKPSGVAVLNDTVASMLGGASIVDPALVERTIGLIVGTGFNISAFFSPKVAPKLAAITSRPMAVNLESGNFSPQLSDFDEAVDAASNNQGAQRYEKAVSGHYLPKLFGQIRGLSPDDCPKSSAVLVELRASGEGEAQTVAADLLARSADLVAAGLSAVTNFFDKKESAVLAEGSLFWGDPEFADRVSATMKRLNEDRSTKLVRLVNANLIGSATAALTPFEAE